MPRNSWVSLLLPHFQAQPLPTSGSSALVSPRSEAAPANADNHRPMSQHRSSSSAPHTGASRTEVELLQAAYREVAEVVQQDILTALSWLVAQPVPEVVEQV